MTAVPFWTLEAVDDAGPDGSTLYVCRDEWGVLVGTSLTPWPAERHADDSGAVLVRRAPLTGGTDESHLKRDVGGLL